ncbi:MAG: transposase [Treponema sp.]|jgi:transposase-like protein|nr:transposase [Treponema sp.]
MGKKDKKRRVCPKEFKVGAMAPAEKREKPIRQAATDLGVGDKLLYRWRSKPKSRQGRVRRPFPDMDGPGLRKEVNALMTANEIPKMNREFYAEEAGAK